MLPLKKYRGVDGKRSSKHSVTPVTTEPAEAETSTPEADAADADSADGDTPWWYKKDFGGHHLQPAEWTPYTRHASRKIEHFWRVDGAAEEV